MKTRNGDDFQPKAANISGIKSLDQLIQNYPNLNIIPQFIRLKQFYPCYRAVMGDGNCFYRAIAFLYLREANLNNFSKVFQTIKNVCTGHSIYFQGQTFETRLHKIYELCLFPLRNMNQVERQQELACNFNNSFVFDTMMIMYFRSLNYHHISSNEKSFRDFISNPNSIQTIKIYSTESQGVEYSSMAQALNIKIVMNVTDERDLSKITYNQNAFSKTYDLFFRPGHFDILYHRNSELLSRNLNNYSRNSPQRGRLSYQNQPNYTHNSPQRLRLNQQNQPESKYSFLGQPNNKVLQKQKSYPSIPKHKIPSIFSFSDQQKTRQQPKEKAQGQDRMTKVQNQPPKQNSNIFSSMNPLRSSKAVDKQQKQKQLTPQVQQRQKSNKNQFSQASSPIKTQKYKAWQQGQNSNQNQPWRKVQQASILALFLMVASYIAFKI